MINILDAIAEGKELHKRLEELREELKHPAGEAGRSLIKAAAALRKQMFPDEHSDRHYETEWFKYTDTISLDDDFSVMFIEYGRCGDLDTTHHYVPLEQICTEELREEYIGQLRTSWEKQLTAAELAKVKARENEIAALEARLAALKAGGQ
jgi:hypothetical protein